VVVVLGVGEVVAVGADELEADAEGEADSLALGELLLPLESDCRRLCEPSDCDEEE
jgi:hypothetical protein